MSKKLFSLGLFFFTASLFSTDLVARAFKPNVYECKGPDFSLTYSAATWDGEPILVVREKRSVKNKQEHRGKENIKVMEGIFGVMINVTDHSYKGEDKAFLSLLAPKMTLEPFDQVKEFDTILVHSVLNQPTASLASTVKENTYTALKCRARHHAE